MDLTGAGGGLMLVLAAGLWLVYLVPNWLRREEFAATERNAVRLQRTIRVLAETAEAPTADRAKPRPLDAGTRSVAVGDRAGQPQWSRLRSTTGSRAFAAAGPSHPSCCWRASSRSWRSSPSPSPPAGRPAASSSLGSASCSA